MKIPFDPSLAWKILCFYLVIDLAALPILLLLNLNLLWSYLSIILFEGFCSLVVGCILLFSTLFSTIEVEDHKYVGDGFLRYELKPIELSETQNKAMRKKGVTMVIVGLLLMSSPTVLMLHTLLSTF
jgi:hypothetical protein